MSTEELPVATNEEADQHIRGITFEKEDPETLFEILGVIGRGSFGSVFKARNRVTNELVAVKQMLLANEEEIEVVRREVFTLAECVHPNVVRYRGAYRSFGALWITMEYCAGGSIDEILKTLRRPLTEPQIAFVTREVLKGLMYLHSMHIIHRDIKGGNILLTEDGEVKIGDFGVSTQLMNTISRRNSFIGTLYWMAPEAIQEREYDERADLWSLGITVIELAELAPPHLEMHYARALLAIPKEAPPVLQNGDMWSPAMNRFVARCLTKDPPMRPTAAMLMSDPFISDCTATKEGIKELLASHRKKAEALAVSGGERSAQSSDSERASEGHIDGEVQGSAEPPLARESTGCLVQEEARLLDFIVSLPLLSLDDLAMDELCSLPNETSADALSVLRGPSEPSPWETNDLPPTGLLTTTKSLLHCMRHNKELVFTQRGLSREEQDRARVLVVKYGSVLRATLRI